jgi:hypothetical protein
MTPEELKAHLMGEALKAIEALIARKPKAEDITLSEIEQLAVEGGRNFREAVLASLVGESSGANEGDEHSCPRCGQAMHYKGKRPKDVVTEAGEVRIERDYYYCAHCRQGVFPPG